MAKNKTMKNLWGAIKRAFQKTPPILKQQSGSSGIVSERETEENLPTEGFIPVKKGLVIRCDPGRYATILKAAAATDSTVPAHALARMHSRCAELEEDLSALLSVWQEEIDSQTDEKSLDRTQRRFERQARHIIRKLYTQQWLGGKRAAGNEAALGTDEAVELTKMQRNEQQFFLNLIADTRFGTWGMDPERRVSMYGKASAEAFWAGYALSNLRADIYLKWTIREEKEHCGDCDLMANGGRWSGTPYAGTYAARELARIGVFPASGQLQCCTNCGCELVKVARPELRPKSRSFITSMPVVGPKRSSFSGQGRSGRGRLERLAGKYQWRHRGRM